MKNTNRLLAATLLLTPALLAFSPRGTAIKFNVTEGATRQKTFTSVAELTLDEMGMLLNGQESPMMPAIEMSMTTSFDVTVTDEYTAMGDGRVKKLARTFDSINSSTDLAMEIDIMGQVQNQDMSMPSSSELEGMEILFTLGEDGEYTPSFPEEEGDEKLLAGLSEDMDLLGFLPPGEVEEGDEWAIDPITLSTALAPGGDLKLLPEDMDSADMMGMNQEMGDLSDWFSDDIEGEVKGTFKGTRETEDGVKVAVISIMIDITNAVDLTEMMQEGLSEMPSEAGEMEVGSMDMALAIEGEGTLLWDLSAGCAHSFEMTGDFSMQMDIAMNISAQGQEMEIEQSMEFSGSLTNTATFGN
jgi:hypothetical protein